MANQQSKNRKRGNLGEMLVKRRLELLGVCMVEKIETGWTIIRGKGGRVVDAFPNEKVSGDFRGVMPDGRSVLVEAKTIPNKLQHSNLEEHQREALQAHHELGGLSLVAWVHDPERDGVAIFQWPHEGFIKRTSMTLDKVQEWTG